MRPTGAHAPGWFPRIAAYAERFRLNESEIPRKLIRSP